MAPLFTYTLFTLQFIFFATTRGAFYDEISQTIAIKQEEKTTHLHFYFHDIVGGENSSVIKIAGPPKNSSSSFGTTMMMDDVLTEGPEITSKAIGRAQGLYAMASQSDLSLLMVANYVFFEGVYNGSSISVLGRNHVFDEQREMPIVGGSGGFRNAHGYALAHSVNIDEHEAVVEYNVYVTHY
ncbi:Disease resistance-responsive (dirigent-like protein) family protein [Euphorbia peplus]|nr:Disease resistance-responsive (dirigent-like protein) family protein [Euphorbia peplus]